MRTHNDLTIWLYPDAPLKVDKDLSQPIILANDTAIFFGGDMAERTITATRLRDALTEALEGVPLPESENNASQI